MKPTSVVIVLVIAIGHFSSHAFVSLPCILPLSEKAKFTSSHLLPTDIITSTEIDPPPATHQVGLYIHIPYCRRRCRYCNFSIIPIGSRPKDDSQASQAFLEMDRNYTDALLQELTNTPIPHETTLVSVYLGGGTPSLAPVESIQRILEAVRRFRLAPDAEITMEMDPGTFSLAQAQALRELGVNRISLGVQSFHDGMLESLGRVHRYKDIVSALSILETVFGDDLNYSIDLISGLPGLSLAGWAETLEMATNLKPRPTHMSLYDLQVESVSH